MHLIKKYAIITIGKAKIRRDFEEIFLKMKKDGTIYECYSSKQHEYLQKLGFKHVAEFIHNRTKVQCYVYEVSEELSQALATWRANRPVK